MANKDIVIEYTEADVAKMRAEGIEEDAIPSVGKHEFERVSPDRVFSRKNSKMRINIFLDSDIIHHFRERAAKPNAAPYQTQINAELRAVMERDLGVKDPYVGAIGEELLESEEFISKLSKKLKQKKLQRA